MRPSCDPHATFMRPSCDPHATLMRPSCDHHATIMRPSCDSKATPKPGRGNHLFTQGFGHDENCWRQYVRNSARMLTKSSVGNLPVRLGTFPPPGTSSWPGGTPRSEEHTSELQSL